LNKLFIDKNTCLFIFRTQTITPINYVNVLGELFIFVGPKNHLMKLILITIGLLAIGVAGIAIKIWAKKDGEFAGTCASQNPMLNKTGEACGFCGKTSDQFEDCTEPTHN